MRANKLHAKRNRSAFLLVGIVAFSLLSITAIQVEPARAARMQYFPLAPGSYLVYNSTTTGDTWETKRYIGEDWEFVGGLFGGFVFGTFMVHWYEARRNLGESDFTPLNRMWLWKTDDTLMWQGFEDLETGTKVFADNPLSYVREPITVGQVLGGSTTAKLTIGGMILPVTFLANYTVEAIESITVPYGTIANCIRVNETEVTPDGNVNFTVWYAPNMGAVRYYYPAENRWDNLTSLNVDINNDPWDTWFMPKVPILVGWIVVIGVSLVVTFIVVKVVKKVKLRKSTTPVPAEP